jgi:hypothetical protein
MTGSDVWVQAPATGNYEMFVATRISNNPDTALEKKYYVQEPEEYTIGLSFAVQAPRFFADNQDSTVTDEDDNKVPRYSRGSENVKLLLYDEKGKEVSGKISKPANSKRLDIVKLKDLLKAAGVSDIDGESVGPSTTKSIRYTGAVLMVVVNCLMERSTGSIGECHLEPKRVENAQAKMSVVTDVESAATAKVQSRRGIKIIFQVSGEMARFDYNSCLVAWVSALGMLGLASIAVDLIMTKLLSLKTVYKLLKYDESVDFGDYKAGDPDAVAAVKHLEDDAAKRKAHKQELKCKQVVPAGELS